MKKVVFIIGALIMGCQTEAVTTLPQSDLLTVVTYDTGGSGGVSLLDPGRKKQDVAFAAPETAGGRRIGRAEQALALSADTGESSILGSSTGGGKKQDIALPDNDAGQGAPGTCGTETGGVVTHLKNS